MGFLIEGVAAGEGMLDLRWVLQQVVKFGKCRSVLVESWLNAGATLEETIAKEKQMAENSIHYIKSIIHD
jgi:3-oxoisoapionate decarboxylase